MTRDAIDAADLVAHAELTEIRVYEIGGRRLLGGAEASEPAEDFQVQATGDSRHFETRARLILVTNEAELLADVSAVHSFDEDLVISREVAAEFTRRVGIMSVYPFVREQIFTSATRLGVAAPVLGMLRAGQFNIEMSGEADPDPQS